MNQRGGRAGLGITMGIVVAIVLAIGLVDMALDDGSTESRTPIDVASLGPQVGERVPAFSLPD